MRYKKIKYDGDTVELQWHTGNNNGTVTNHTQQSTERPAPAFTKALEAFRDPVEKLLRVQEFGVIEGSAEGNTKTSYFDSVSGISTSVEEDDERGIVITLRKVIEVAGEKLVLVVNTPSMIVRGEFENLLSEAEYQAERFGQGKREQTDLFVDPDRRSAAEKEESDDAFAAAVQRGNRMVALAVEAGIIKPKEEEDDTLAGAIAKSKKKAATRGAKR